MDNPNYIYNERTGAGSVDQPSGHVTLKLHWDEIVKILDHELPPSVDQKTVERIADRFETYMLENHMQAIVDRHDRVIDLSKLELPPRQEGNWGE